VKGKLFVANAGDSRCVLAVERGGTLKARRLSRDHKPDDEDEKQRIEENGGTVSGGRVRNDVAHSSINMSRALGDMDFKMPLNQAPGDHITWEPFMSPTINIDQNTRFLIVASDGLWA